MSYIVIKVYSFECDDCGKLFDVTPRPDKRIMLRDAESELRRAGWRVRDGSHHCPEHADTALLSKQGRNAGMASAATPLTAVVPGQPVNGDNL